MRALRITLALCGVLFSLQVAAAVMTNKDVILMLEAGMAEDVILQSIRTSQTKFDTSAQALVRLKQKGASPTVLKAMMQPAGAAPADAGAPPGGVQRNASAPARPAAVGLNPEEVLAAFDGKEESMSYIIPGNRTAARALGFGGVAMYAVMNGPRAQRRLPNTVDFIVSVPRSAQAPHYITLANFAVRPNGSREVLIGGGYMSYSTGIHPDRVVKVNIEPLEDQSRARDGFMLHRVRAVAPMPSGEYALVLYTGEVRTLGIFAQAANSYFDFGVD